MRNKCRVIYFEATVGGFAVRGRCSVFGTRPGLEKMVVRLTNGRSNRLAIVFFGPSTLCASICVLIVYGLVRGDRAADYLPLIL